MNSQRIIPILRGDDRSPSAVAARGLLAMAEPFYRLGVAGRNAAFDRGWRTQRRLGRPVLSVGNLTAGGTGKTPLVVDLARRLISMGRRPAVLLRGYRAAATGGSDEEAVLRGELGPDIPLAADADRSAAAERILREHPAVDLFILDDGFQHRQVARDLDLVLIDASEPFGFGRLLPRGLLREPVGGLARADAVLVTRADLVSPAELAALDQKITALAGHSPVAHARFTWTGYRDQQERQVSLDALRHAAVLGVCGVGNPSAFALMLGRCAGRATHRALPDHAAYTPLMLREIFAAAAADGAEAVVTTEKDWVKWRALLGEAGGGGSLPVYRPVLGTEFLDGQTGLEELLRTRLSAKS